MKVYDEMGNAMDCKKVEKKDNIYLITFDNGSRTFLTSDEVTKIEGNKTEKQFVTFLEDSGIPYEFDTNEDGDIHYYFINDRSFSFIFQDGFFKFNVNYQE